MQDSPENDDPQSPKKPDWDHVQWHLENQEKKPEDSAATRAVSCIAWLILAAIIGGLLFGFGPFFFGNAHDTSDARNNIVNWAAANFKSHVIIGAFVGLAGGALLWFLSTREDRA